MADRDIDVSDPVVHQAEGALSVWLGVPIDEAAMILRIRATNSGLSLECMADEVLHPVFPSGDPNIAGSC